MVAGDGGYHNLHQLAPDARAGTPDSDEVIIEAGDDRNWGFLTVTASGGSITGNYTSVTSAGKISGDADVFRT